MKKNNQKNTKRKAYESLILLLLTISLFVTATFAWFTDSAFSKGNKVFAGNLYVDVVETEKVLQDIYQDEWISYKTDNSTDISFSDYLQTVKGYKLYERKYQDGEDVVTDNYYIITGTDASTINLYNLEPGQVRDVNIKYINRGDLALSAAGALKIDYDDVAKRYKSYTGLETLSMQFNEATEIGAYDVYYNDYAVNFDSDGDSIPDTIDPKLIKEGLDSNENEKSYNHVSNGFDIQYDDDRKDEYKRRFFKLYAYQGINPISNDEFAVLPSEEQIKYSEIKYESMYASAKGRWYIDNGGHLEDVLEVFIGVDKTATGFDREAIYKNKDKKYYFGTLTQFIYLLDNGPLALKDFDYSLYEDSINPETNEYALLKKASSGNVPVGTIAADELKTSLDQCETAEEIYMFMCKDASYHLYDNYDRYLSNASGHCLPADSITNSENVIPSKDGVEVKVYENGEVTHTYMASEMGECSFSLYLPENVDSRYQNASISLSMGVTATQADFEMDDTGYMIYDKVETKGVSITYINENGKIAHANLPADAVLSIDIDGATALEQIPNEISIEDYLKNSIDFTKTPYSDLIKDGYEFVGFKLDVAALTLKAIFKESKTIKVGIIQYVTHDAINNATQGFINKINEEFGDSVVIDTQNANGDIYNLGSIASKLIGEEKVDLIVACGTPALQAAAVATTNIPILGLAISDYGAALSRPVENNIVGGNISGTSDAVSFEALAQMFTTLTSDAKTVGVIYNSIEENSVYQKNGFGTFATINELQINEYSFSDSNDIGAVTQISVSQVDVLYIPNDNICASNAEIIGQIASDAGFLIICSDKYLCKNVGGIAAYSIDYYNLGISTAVMAIDILKNNADISTMQIVYDNAPIKFFNNEVGSLYYIQKPEGYYDLE